jgi:hypothetical protein
MTTIPTVHTLVDDTDTVILIVNIPAGSPDEVEITPLYESIATFNGGGRTAEYFTVRKVQWSLQGFSVLLWADADTDLLIGTLSAGSGIITVPGPRPIIDIGLGSTGLVKMSTLNKSGIGDSGVVIIEFDKRGEI